MLPPLILQEVFLTPHFLAVVMEWANSSDLADYMSTRAREHSGSKVCLSPAPCQLPPCAGPNDLKSRLLLPPLHLLPGGQRVSPRRLSREGLLRTGVRAG